MSCQTICMNCQILFTGENKKNTFSLWSAELAKRVVEIRHKNAKQFQKITISENGIIQSVEVFISNVDIIFMT